MRLMRQGIPIKCRRNKSLPNCVFLTLKPALNRLVKQVTVHAYIFFGGFFWMDRLDDAERHPDNCARANNANA